MHPTRREFLRISSGLAAATLATAMPMNQALPFGSATREPSFLAGHFAPVKIETGSFGLNMRGTIMGASLMQRLTLEGAEVQWHCQIARALPAIRTPRKTIDAVICDIRLTGRAKT